MNAAYHITWVTHNSRVSERMVLYKVRRGEPLLLNEEQEVEISRYIHRTVSRDKISVLAYNICRDHIHMVLICDPRKRDCIVGRLKSEATQNYKKHHDIEERFHLWAQKYNYWAINNEKQLVNTIEYIRYNRRKHKLPANRRLRPIVSQMVSGLDCI